MARIRTLTKSAHSISPHKTEVDATYQAVIDPDGTVLFHLSTYGSDDRASLPKVSQTFQINETMSREIVKAIEATFGA